MPKISIPPTRSNLIRIKKELQFAREGYEILDRKREVLTTELIRMAHDASVLQEEMWKLQAEAYRALEKAQLTMGEEHVEWAALAAHKSVDVQLKFRGIMGVPLPIVEASGGPPEMPYSLGDTSVTLDEASAALGEDVRQLDSARALASTRAVQLCLLIAGVAHARLLERTPDYVAGLSIGAYPAAVIAGALDFADAVRLVSLRGELMQQAYPQGYGMTALIGPDLSTVETLLAEIHRPETPVYLANINADNQTVIAGSDEAMQRVAQRVKGNGIAKRLAVSVPSHCALLERPAQALAEAFVTLKAPRITYLSSTRARPIHDPAQLRDDLAFNMCRVVDWRGTVQSAYERGVRLQIELPPGAVLTGLSRRVFEQGTVIACEGARLDTLQALLEEEDRHHR